MGRNVPAFLSELYDSSNVSLTCDIDNYFCNSLDLKKPEMMTLNALGVHN